MITFKFKQHAQDVQIIEVWLDDVFVAAIYGRDDELTVLSKRFGRISSSGDEVTIGLKTGELPEVHPGLAEGIARVKAMDAADRPLNGRAHITRRVRQAVHRRRGDVGRR